MCVFHICVSKIYQQTVTFSWHEMHLDMSLEMWAVLVMSLQFDRCVCNLTVYPRSESEAAKNIYLYISFLLLGIYLLQYVERYKA